MMPRWFRKSIDKCNLREISSLSFVHTLAIESNEREYWTEKREKPVENDSRG